ncbi:putative ribonuclease H-like domain-containing protein [Tanacetum coccineum]
MSYDEIRPLFKVEYNKVQNLLNKKGLEIDAERIEALRNRTREDKVEKDQSDKKQKGDENAKTVEEEDDTEEMKRCLEIMPDDEDLLVDAIPQAERSPTVVDYRVYKEGKKKFYQVFREDGNYQMFFTFKQFLMNFNREDLECLCKIVKERFGEIEPKEDIDIFLLHTFKYMFNHHVEDNVWKQQHGPQGLAKVKRWKLFDSCGVYFNLRLEVDRECQMDIDLIRLDCLAKKDSRLHKYKNKITTVDGHPKENSKDTAIAELKRKLNLAQKEKDGIQFTVENFKNLSKCLKKLIDSQIHEKCKKGLGYNVVPPPYTGNFMPPKPDLIYSDIDEIETKTVVSESGGEVGSSEGKPKVVRDSALIIDDWTFDDENMDVCEPKIQKQVHPSFPKIKFVKAKDQNQSFRKPVKYAEMYRSQRSRGNQRNWNGMMSQRLSSNWEMFNKSCYECGSFEHLVRDCEYHQRKIKNHKVVKPVWKYSQRVNHRNFAKKNQPNAKRNQVLKAALTVNVAKQNLSKAAVTVNTTRPITTANLKRTMNSANQKVKIVRRNVSAVKGKRVNAIKQIQVSNGLGSQNVLIFLIEVKGNPQEILQDKEVIDSGWQTTTGKEFSNLLMASSLLKTTLPTKLCIKQFWTPAKVKTVNDEFHVQDLVDEKRIIVKESSIRHALRLDDAEGTSCLPNAEIFEQLAKMRYEKPLEKLTFYKAFFSPKWKFLIHTILQCLSAKTTLWNEFSSIMASAIICLATNQKFNFSKYILLNMIKNIEAGVPFYMFPRFVQLIINRQLGDLTHHKGIFDNPSLTKKVFANMKRVGTGFSGEITPLFDNMLIQAPKEVGTLQADEQDIPIPTEPSTSKPQKKHKPKRKHNKEPEGPPTEPQTEQDIPFPSPSYDPLLSGEDSLKLKELIDLCTSFSSKVLDLKSEVIDIKSTHKAKVAELKCRVAKLEEENRMILKEIKGVHSKVDSDEPVMEKEESSKHGLKIQDIDHDAEINLVKDQAEM